MMCLYLNISMSSSEVTDLESLNSRGHSHLIPFAQLPQIALQEHHTSTYATMAVVLCGLLLL